MTKAVAGYAKGQSGWLWFCCLACACSRLLEPARPLLSPTNVHYGLMDCHHTSEGLVGKLKDGRWSKVLRQPTRVAAGDLLEVRVSAQATTEDARACFRSRLRVDDQEIGGGVVQSICQPNPAGGNHHTPMTAVGTWLADRDAEVKVEFEMRCDIEQPEIGINDADLSSAQPFGRLTVSCFRPGKGAGLSALRPCSAPSASGTHCRLPLIFEPLMVMPLAARAGDYGYFFATLNASHLSDEEAGTYKRPHQDYDGEQVGTVFSLREQAASANHGENLCSGHPRLQAFNSAAVRFEQPTQEVKFHVGGAYTRGARLEDLAGYTLTFSQPGRPLAESRELFLKAEDFQQGHWSSRLEAAAHEVVRVTLLLNLTSPKEPEAVTTELTLGDQSTRAVRTLGGSYPRGFVRLELVAEAAGPLPLAISAGAQPVDGYLLVQRFSAP